MSTISRVNSLSGFGQLPKQLLKKLGLLFSKRAVSKAAMGHCSFCGKSPHQVQRLVAGPNVFICDECVHLCNEIIAEGTSQPNN